MILDKLCTHYSFKCSGLCIYIKTGYIRQQLREMKVMCEPLFPQDSVLECSSYLRFCRGRNIFVNFTDVALRKEPVRYKTDILKQGNIGNVKPMTLRQRKLPHTGST